VVGEVRWPGAVKDSAVKHDTVTSRPPLA